MTGGRQIPWPVEHEDTLRAMWSAGNSGTEIGVVLRRTRSAIIGKAHRMGLEKRRSPASITAPRGPKRQTKFNFKRRVKPTAPRPASVERPKPPALETIVPLNGRGITILELQRDQCHAVIVEQQRHSRELARYCGNQVQAGSRYCLGHHHAFHRTIP